MKKWLMRFMVVCILASSFTLFAQEQKRDETRHEEMKKGESGEHKAHHKKKHKKHHKDEKKDEQKHDEMKH